MFKLVLEKAEETDQIPNIRWIIEKAREFQKNIYFCFIDCAKAFDCADHNKLLKGQYHLPEVRRTHQYAEKKKQNFFFTL